MTLNCDLGERGVAHPVDVVLVGLADVANIACGGHAGDATSVRFYRDLAELKGVAVCAHLSYPDRDGFGRSHVELPVERLLASLDEQKRLLEDISMVKLHGALYNESCSTPSLAAALAEWMRTRGVASVLTMPLSELASRATEAGLRVISEAFVERRYRLSPEGGKLVLVDRSREGAVIRDLEAALEQARVIVLEGRVLDEEGLWRALRAETLCIHSDSPIALELARRVRALLDGVGAP